MTNYELVNAALGALKMSYSPYSGFKVGAALLTKSGKLYTGCNIENSSFSPTVCAERTAIFKAISEGQRDFDRIAVAGGKDGKITGFCSPCGVCRQVLAEFCSKDFVIVTWDGAGDYRETALGELLPESFTLK